MAFQTGLSGLNTASRNLDVIGNNIANANTVGMKASRAEFADLIASTNGLSGSNTAGIGTSVATVSQQFAQGNINITGNDLDIAINGGGFFQLTMPDGSAAYTRDGQFKLNTTGEIVTNTGANVMGYPTDAVTGLPTSSTTQALTLPTTAPIAAKATDTIVAEFNLDARAAVAATATPPTPRTTYGTSLNAYDSQGIAWPVNLYFVKVPSTTTDNWNVYTNADPLVQADNAPTFTMSFGADGSLSSPTTMPTITVPTTGGVTGDISATLDISDVTQYGANFAVSNLTQNGYAPGELVSLKIGEKGVITARYSNGQTQAAGQVALANFRNVQGLAPSGGGNWRETAYSGQPVLGAPGQGKLGVLNAGAVEESNVDLTAELVNMMTAQRAYQANAQTIKTQDQVMSTLVNLR